MAGTSASVKDGWRPFYVKPVEFICIILVLVDLCFGKSRAVRENDRQMPARIIECADSDLGLYLSIGVRQCRDVPCLKTMQRILVIPKYTGRCLRVFWGTKPI